MCQENYRKWQNEKGNGFCALLYGAGDVYHDAASESCLGRDTYSAVSGGGVSAVLLLKMFSQRPFEPAARFRCAPSRCRAFALRENK